VDLHAIERRAARLAWSTHLVEWHAGVRRLDLAEPISQFARRAGRGVRLVFMRVVDDLEVVEIARRDSAKRCSSTTVSAKLPQARTPRSPARATASISA